MPGTAGKKMEVIIAPQARSDIASILAWTEENFGPQTLRRYSKLIATAIEQVAENPECAGSCSRPEIADRCQTYHLFFSRKAAGRAGDRVRHPRHFLLYRLTESGEVEIGRVLHDSMEMMEHLPEVYRRSR
jgi:toxin ParE1/3/4